jgi:hypothetical protein
LSGKFIINKIRFSHYILCSSTDSLPNQVSQSLKNFWKTNSSLKTNKVNYFLFPGLAKLRKDHGNKIIGEVKVDDAVLGMRGLPLMLYDGSALDPQSGITFRGYSIPEFQKNAQKAPGGY